MDFSSLVLAIISGIVVGSMYALMSVGLSLIWGAARMFNFAHGALFTLGAYLLWYIMVESALVPNYAVAVLITIVLMFLIGVAIERVAIRPLFNRPNPLITTIISTLGVNYIIQYAILLMFTGLPKRIPPFIEGTLCYGEFVIPFNRILICIIAISLLCALRLILTHTRVGLAIRAVSQDKDASCLVGINPNRVFSYTYGFAAVLAGIAGMLIGSITLLVPTGGFTPFIWAFVVVVFGGLGSVEGTILASYILGIVNEVSVLFFGYFISYPLLFLFLIVILLVRPAGLLGLKEMI